MMASEEPQQRSSSGSGRSAASRSRLTPQQQLSQIEKSVTHLLVATKQLLETLTLWSRGSSTEAEVSDVYVRLGYEFNIACRAFNSIGVETQDLGPVPDLLRSILEETLSQEASQASLDRFLPRIRDIIINLLHGLKKKQSRLRQKSAQSGGSSRQTSIASTSSGETTLTQTLDDAVARQQNSRSFVPRSGSGDLIALDGPDLPPRTTSTQSGRVSPRREGYGGGGSMHRARESSRETLNSTDSSMSSSTMQNLPVIAPYPPDDKMGPQTPSIVQEEYDEPPPPPPPPPKQPPIQRDALAALQRGGDLERRASRRFSAYQIQKHLGTPNGVPMMPVAQTSPIPNRGRDTRESMNAVRTRSTYLQNRQRSAAPPRVVGESSPLRNGARDAAGDRADNFGRLQQASDVIDSPTVKTPEDKLAGYPFPTVGHRQEERLGATVNGQMIDEPMTADGLVRGDSSSLHRQKSAQPTTRVVTTPPGQQSPPRAQQQLITEASPPQPGKELTLFLQYKSKIKKFVLPDGGDLTIARLQLAFIEKFAWNTHSNGIDLPEIYIQDPVSGVRHELEDLSDIKERSVLVLNVEALDEVKRHFDDGLGGIRQMIQGIRSAVDDQQSAIQLVSDRQQESAKEIASLAAAPPRISLPTSSSRGMLNNTGAAGQLNEVQSLRRDLAVVRQTYTSFVADINASMSTIRTKASSVRATADKARVPAMTAGTGRAYVNNGKKNLQDDSEKIVTQVDDLQDTVEDLRKDVVTRGVRPLPRQLETVSKDISSATAQLKKLQEYLKREKPLWTKIWEKELQVVCDDRDLLTMQEELCVDLEDDLEKAAATFALVEQATRQQNLQNPTGARSSSRTLNPVVLGGGGDPLKAKDGVLGEVKALQPNHETRLEAIERAEKARQKELESRRGGEFQKELGSFVDEGKLKKSGGVEEAERLRKAKDERIRREVWERQNARAAAAAAKEASQTNGEDSEPTAEPDIAKDDVFSDMAIPVEKPMDSSTLDVPNRDEGAASPDAVFVEAKETPPTPGED